METGKWEERSAISQAPRCYQTDADNVNVSVKGFEKESDPEAGVGSTAEDSGTMSQRTAKKLMELFCDEAVRKSHTPAFNAYSISTVMSIPFPL